MILKRNLIQAPLAGYSCAPLRKLAWQWGRPDFCCTEMLSALHIHSGAKQRERYCYKDPDEGKLCVQLAADNVTALACSAEKVVAWGADLIDLNCGCPQPKIRKKNYGSKLLQDSKKIYELISTLKSMVDVPVMVKIRVDARSADNYNVDVAKAIEDAGVDLLSVHGRHWTEGYDVAVSYQDIAQIKSMVSMPVIGCGDIADTVSAKRMYDETGCDALMIGRASVGQPWIFEQIYQELQDLEYIPPSTKEIGEMFLQHARGLVELEGERIAMLQCRKLGKYYVRDHFSSDSFMEAISQLSHFSELQMLVNENFV